HRLGDVAQGQLAVQHEVVPVEADAGGAVRHRGVFLNVQEVCGPDVLVALGDTGVDRGQVDRGGHTGVEGVLTGHDRPLDRLEAAADLGDHQMTDGEADVAVDGVDGPGARDIAGDLDE